MPFYKLNEGMHWEWTNTVTETTLIGAFIYTTASLCQ